MSEPQNLGEWLEWAALQIENGQAARIDKSFPGGLVKAYRVTDNLIRIDWQPRKE